MAFDYGTKVAAIKDLLVSYNTTTASPYLSNGLNQAVDDNNIRAGDIETVAIKSVDFPCIFIKVNNKSETFETIGRTGASNALKACEVEYDINAMVRKYGMWTKNDDLLSEVYKLAENIESVIREDVTLNNSANWAQIESSEFVGGALDSGIFLQGCLLRLKAKYYFK